MIETKKIVKSFEDGEMYVEESIHKTLLIIMLWYIAHEPDFCSAVIKFKIFNSARNRHKADGLAGTAEYYRETETLFWAKELNDLYGHYKEKMDFAEIKALMLATANFFDKEYIFQFYSKEVLASKEAKAWYIEPDLGKPIQLDILKSTLRNSI